MTKSELLQNAKPILFNTEMVRAILDGRKTVMRIVVKQVDNYLSCNCGVSFSHNENMEFYCDRCVFPLVCGSVYNDKNFLRPPYKPDDILYVRETWGIYTKDWNDTDRFLYRADYPNGATGYWHEPKQINWCDLPNWRPSIHMPKEAARIFLRVKDVRAERLQEITEEECCAEGYDYKCPCEHRVAVGNPYYGDGYEGMCWSEGDCINPDKVCDLSVPEHFGKTIWNSTIKKSELHLYGWEANPFVWTIEFERIEI